LRQSHAPCGRCTKWTDPLVASGKWELSLQARCAKGQESLRLLVQVEDITRPRPDVVPRLVDKRSKRHRSAVPLPLQHHPEVLTLVPQAAGSCDHVEQPFASWLSRKTTGGRAGESLIDFAEDRNERAVCGH